MAFQALYRKWRPDTFDEMIGQDAVTATLKNQLRSGRIGHAYLFCGTRGTGKTSAAKIMARAVNCPNAAEHGGEPCNQCETCLAIKNGSSMEVFEIDAASNTSVDGIRAIQEEIAYPPVTGKYKVYIIDEVHMLSASAYNALLKTLEEPPAYLIFILATTDPQKIPATVLSRCQRYDFKRIGKKLIEDRFRQILDSEGYNVEDKAISYIAELADGSMRDGLSIMDQCLSYASGGVLSYEDVLKIMGAVDPSVYSRLYRSILAGDIEGALIEIGSIIDNGADVMLIISDMVSYLRNVLLAGSLRGESADLLDISESRLSMAREDAARTEKPVLLNMLMEFSELTNKARYAPRKRLLLEMLIIKLCARNAGAGGNAFVSDNSRQAEGMASPVIKRPSGLTHSGQTEDPREREPAAGAEAERKSKAASELTQGSRDNPPWDDAEKPGAVSGAENRAAASQASGTGADKREMAGQAADRTMRMDSKTVSAVKPGENVATVSGSNSRATMESAVNADMRLGNRAVASQAAGTGAGADNRAAASQAAATGTGSDNHETGSTQNGMPVSEQMSILKKNWPSMVQELAPSNRKLFSETLLKMEGGQLVLIFKSSINFKLAAANIEENGVLKLRELASRITGEDIKFMARVARPGEIAKENDRATDEELASINFHIDIED